MKDTGDLSIPLPKKPKSNLTENISGKCYDKTKTVSIEHFHEYLVSKEAISIPEVEWKAYWGENLESIAINLKEGLSHVEMLKKKMLCHYVNLGRSLERAYHLIAKQKEEGACNFISWKEWLEENAGLEESYVRKLRGLYRDFYQYSRLGILSVSLTEMLKLKPKLLTLLATNRECAKYWKTI